MVAYKIALITLAYSIPCGISIACAGKRARVKREMEDFRIGITYKVCYSFIALFLYFLLERDIKIKFIIVVYIFEEIVKNHGWFKIAVARA